MYSSDIAVVVKFTRNYRYVNRDYVIDYENETMEEVQRFDELGKGLAQLTNEARALAKQLNDKYGNELIEFKVHMEAR